MENEPQSIDIHDNDRNLERELQVLEACKQILPENRRTLIRFIRDCRLGRTVKRGARRRLTASRCRKLIFSLKVFAIRLDCAFESVTPERMEQFILDLEEGRIKKRKSNRSSGAYRVSTVVDIKKILKKFYRWLIPDHDRVEELVGWFDTADQPPELKTFGYDDVEKMMMHAPTLQARCLLKLLFDGGFRAGEIFNVRLADVTFSQSESRGLLGLIRIRVSKTKPRTVSLPLATDHLIAWCEAHPEGGRVWPDGRFEPANPQATLVIYSYHYCQKLVRQLGGRVLGERMYLHRFRHSSATYYAKRLSHYQLAARFGWTMSSNAISRYVDASGILADQVARIVQGELTSQEQRQRTLDLVQQLRADPVLLDAVKMAVQGGVNGSR